MINNLIKKRIRTKKTQLALKRRKYVFSVDSRLTKPQIKKLFEDFFKVQVESVNTHIKPIKKKRVGLKTGYKQSSKRAIVTLKKNQHLFF